MSTVFVSVVAAVCLVALVGCGEGGDATAASAGASGSGGSGGTSGSGGTPGTGGTAGESGSGGAAGSAGAPAGTTTLISAGWTLASGSEKYICTRLTMTEDLYVTEFHPVNPKGTHHTFLTVQPPGTPDGTAECGDPFEGGPQQLYGSGVGAQPMKLPSGTAVKIAKGQQLHLNLHVFNVGTSELSGTSAVEVVTTTAAEVQHEADLRIWGKTQGLMIPPSTTSEHSASCSVPAPVTLFIVQPHMHQIGKHLKLSHTPLGGTTTPLFDQDYSFESQVHVALDPMVSLGAGDDLTITCTYDNPLAQEVTFGESSTDEMCFVLLFMYPASSAFCNN